MSKKDEMPPGGTPIQRAWENGLIVGMFAVMGCESIFDAIDYPEPTNAFWYQWLSVAIFLLIALYFYSLPLPEDT